MPRYYHDHSYHHQIHFIRKIRWIVLVLAILLLGVVVYFFIDSRRMTKLTDVASGPTEKTTAVYSVPLEVFSTKYFQFQASKGWVYIANESSPDSKYVYRKLNKTLVEHELYIHTNDPIFQEAATYVLPVKSNPDGSLESLGISEHCKKVFNGPLPGAPRVAKLDGVTFLCNPSGAEYKVVTGIAGASSAMQLQRPGGGSATYHIIYNNVKFSPDEREFIKIVDSFQTR